MTTPRDVRMRLYFAQAGDLCMKGGRQVYESHISWEMRFLVDLNLAGMNFVRIAKPRVRHPLPDEAPQTIAASRIDAECLSACKGCRVFCPPLKAAQSSLYADSAAHRLWLAHNSSGFVSKSRPKTTSCLVEVDADVQEIANRMGDSIGAHFVASMSGLGLCKCQDRRGGLLYSEQKIVSLFVYVCV